MSARIEDLGRRALKLEPGEMGKALQFALLAGMIQAGIVVGLTAADTLFLSRVGFEKIPYVFMATPFVMAVYVPVFAFLIGRFGTPRTLNLTLVALIVGGAGLYWWIPATGLQDDGSGFGLVYYVARLYSDLWYIALYSLFWNFTDTFFDIQDAKRLFPLFTAGMAVGAMVGGGLVVLVAGLAGLEFLYLVWSTLALLTLPVVRSIRRRHESLEESDAEVEAGLLDQLKETGQALARSRFVLLLVTVLVAVVMLNSINEYEYLRILSGPLNEEELGSLLGRLLVAVNVFNLVFCLFLFNRLVLAVGVGTVALVQPLTYLAVFYFLLFQGGIGAAVFGFVALNGILPSIEFNNQNFLFNAVPQRVKQQVRTAVEGMAEPLATAMAGAMLLVLSEFFPAVRVAAIGFLLACLYLALAVALRNAYLPSLVKNLRLGWLDLTRPAAEALAGLGPEERKRLSEIAATGDQEISRSALRILSINDPHAGVEATLAYLKNASDDEIAEARGFVEALLARAGPDATRAFLDWVGQGSQTLSARFLEEMGGLGLILPSEVQGLVGSDDPSQVAAAVIVLWRSWDPRDRLRASEGLVRLLSGSEKEVVAGLRTVGRLGDATLGRFAASHLASQDPVVRAEAMASLKGIVTPESTGLVPDILDALPEMDERGRYHGLDALGRIADPTCVVRLLEMSVEFSPPVRRSVLRVLERMGLRGVPACVAVFTDPRHPFPARTIAARFLATAAAPQLEATWAGVVDSELERARRFRANRAALMELDEAPSGIRVLRRFYLDTQVRIVDFILEVAHIAGRLPSFEMLSSSLRSDLPKERANALETVEQGMPRRMFKRLKPLIVEPDGDDGLRAELNGALSVEAILADALASPFALEAASAADASWENESEDLLALFRKRLGDLRNDLYRETVVTLAARGQDALTPVDIMDVLASAPFFKTVRVGDLQELSVWATVRVLEDGDVLYERGDPVDHVWVVTDGWAEMDGAPVGAGELLGREALGLDVAYRATVLSRGMTVVAVPTGPLFEVAEVRSTLGVELVRHAVEAHGVRSL